MICFIKTIIRTIIYREYISGHDFKEIKNDLESQDLECAVCGKKSFGSKSWWKVDAT